MQTQIATPTSELFSAPHLSDIHPKGEIFSRIDAICQQFFSRIDWKAAADFFVEQKDQFAAGEFWGKLMRAASVICGFTHHPELRKRLDEAVSYLLSAQGEDGELSTSPKHLQPKGSHGSDIWERKYVLLGLLGYYELSLREDVLDAARRLALYTARQVGKPPKTSLYELGWAFHGMESASILEPVMKLYRLTGEPELLAFGTYIVECGACGREDIFEAARRCDSPFLFGGNGNPKESVAKAYEMMSCFEGLLEYHLATGDKNALLSAMLFADMIDKEEITFLGSGGAEFPYNLGPGTGEQWNLTAYEQSRDNLGLAMETCVTVTYLKLLLRLFRTTGESVYLDRAEVTIYNALLAAMHPDGSSFDYFLTFAGKRGGVDNFGYQLGEQFLTCCSANGPMGLAQIPLHTVMQQKDRLAICLYFEGTYSFPQLADITLSTRYPYEPKATIIVHPKTNTPFELAIRIPHGMEQVTLQCGEMVYHPKADNFFYIKRVWREGDVVTLSGQFPVLCHLSRKTSEPQYTPKVILTKGPLVLARDSRLDQTLGNGFCFEEKPAYEVLPASEREHILVQCQGSLFCDYASAGQFRDDSDTFESWLLTTT